MADLNNVPAVGHQSNIFSTSSQLNIAGAVPANSSQGLSTDLGGAGMIHYDGRDSPMCMTAMLPNGRLDGLHPGLFFIMDLGVYIELENYSVTIFSGLMYHGGSPPRPYFHDPSVDLTKFVRLTYIAYADRKVKMGERAIRLAPAARNGCVEVDPSYVPSVTVPHSSLNFVGHSHGMMEPISAQRFVSRALLQLVQTVCSQMPSDRPLRVDPEAFLNSIHMNNTPGVANPVPGWTLAPGGKLDFARDLLKKELRKQEEKAMRFLPTQIHKISSSDLSNTEGGSEKKKRRGGGR